MTQERDKASRPSYSSILIDALVSAKKVNHWERVESPGACGQSFSASTDLGNLFLVSAEDSVVALDTGATANLVCFSCLAHRKRILARRGIPRVAT